MDRLDFTSGRLNDADNIFLHDHEALRDEFERLKDVLSTPGYVPREIRDSLVNCLKLLLLLDERSIHKDEIEELINSLTSSISPSTSYVTKAARCRLLEFLRQLEILLRVPSGDGCSSGASSADMSNICNGLQKLSVTEVSEKARAFFEFAKDGSNSSKLSVIGADRIEMDENSFTLTVKCKDCDNFKSRMKTVNCTSFHRLLECDAVRLIDLPAEERVVSVCEDCIRSEADRVCAKLQPRKHWYCGSAFRSPSFWVSVQFR